MTADPRPADSAGTPWEGRHFDHNAFTSDDGSAPELLVDAIGRFRAGQVGEVEVIEAFRASRLLIPLVSRLAEAGVGEHGLIVDKSAELAIVTVAGPDGRDVLPVFSSVETMRRWNPVARPVPADAVRVAVAAASEGTGLVVLDPASDTEFAIRRPALWAIAQSQPWLPSYLDAEVLSAFLASAESEDSVASILLDAGDPGARLAGTELLVRLGLRPGLDRETLDALLARLQQRWSEGEIIASRVDSLRLQLATAD
ncbi:SseB family protein [Lacisediminihabitans sp.]|jgi:hypothetical protein|uniref:SseB family protein n=1 Tax=Lacisediminihabitans sp. TaxID=2787631 RepID=UPI002F952468